MKIAGIDVHKKVLMVVVVDASAVPDAVIIEDVTLTTFVHREAIHFLVAAAVQWAERITGKIEGVYGRVQQ